MRVVTTADPVVRATAGATTPDLAALAALDDYLAGYGIWPGIIEEVLGDDETRATAAEPDLARRGDHPSQAGRAGQDPAVRDILLTRRRALLMEEAASASRCGVDPDTPDDAVA